MLIRRTPQLGTWRLSVHLLVGQSIETNDCIKFKYEKTFFVMISIKRFYDSSMSTAPETQWIY